MDAKKDQPLGDMEEPQQAGTPQEQNRNRQEHLQDQKEAGEAGDRK